MEEARHYPICQRKLVITKIIKSIPTTNGQSVGQITVCIDGLMDFSLKEIEEIVILLNCTVKDIKDNYYATR